MVVKKICVIRAGISGLVTAIVDGGTCIASFSLRHIEELMRDMDKNHQLVIWSNFSQIMPPIDLSIYNKFRQELKSLRSQNKV